MVGPLSRQLFRWQESLLLSDQPDWAQPSFSSVHPFWAWSLLRPLVRRTMSAFEQHLQPYGARGHPRLIVSARAIGAASPLWCTGDLAFSTASPVML